MFEDECRAVGLTPAQCGVLTVLHNAPGLDQTSLARALGFDKVTVLRILRGLEARGLVARVPSPGNRRNLSISLSAKGTALLAAAQKPAEQAYQRLLAPLTPERQRLLIELLQELTGALEHEARAPLVAPVQV